MRLRDFIRQNKEVLRAYIEKRLNWVPSTATCFCPKSGTAHFHEDKHKLTNEDFRQWIMSDEDLYRWARRNGVKI